MVLMIQKCSILVFQQQEELAAHHHFQQKSVLRWMAPSAKPDTVFVFQQKEHPKFKRKGDDLPVEHALSLTEVVILPASRTISVLVYPQYSHGFSLFIIFLQVLTRPSMMKECQCIKGHLLGVNCTFIATLSSQMH
ncbi:uncharacterized protein [Henckelia pumila]|uniref:uncharacterized protein n=1 Tax=Henckelia pumila TaxID=405737 RepID=UPI003C6DC306